jgi:hypothetical protein
VVAPNPKTRKFFTVFRHRLRQQPLPLLRGKAVCETADMFRLAAKEEPFFFPPRGSFSEIDNNRAVLHDF